jgi:Pentapeptide repeats (8 copies)
MSNRWAAGPWARWLIGAVAVVLALVIVWALLVPGADWLARHDVGSAKGSLAAARDAARGRLLTLGAGLLAAGALLFTARNFILSREGQVTDRFTKAIEQLGSDKLDVRIGGIYALERIARDSAKDHPTVMEVLTAFIREHSREPWPPSDADSPEQERSIRPDVQAAATVTGRRDPRRDILRIDLTGRLTAADLAHTNLTQANLTHADLTGADLTGASLTGADLRRAHLLQANLLHADLRRATLTRADLTDAVLVGAVFVGADLDGAHLVGADLDGAHLTDARWPEGVPVPGGWMVDTDSGRLKRSDRLSEVMSRYLR